jgi:hypothetical protein
VKFRNALLILAGILFVVGFIALSTLATSQPRTFNFLADEPAKKIQVQPQPVGPGMDVRYYVLNKPYSTVLAAAKTELLQAGWKDTPIPGTYRRGRRGLVQLSTLSISSDPKLIKDIKPNDYANYTVVKVVDPRFRTVLKDRIANWANGKPVG